MNTYNLYCIFYIAFGAFFYGYDSGLTTSVIGYPKFISYFNFDANKIGALGSVYYAGNFAGSLTNLYFPDKIGRLRTIQYASVISVFGAGMQTGAQSLPVMYVGRFFGGYAAGVIYAVCPMYASEIAPPRWRGRVGGLYAINVSFAYALTEWMGLGFSYITTDLAWRLFFGLQLLCPAIMLVGSIWMPQSPRWLIMRDRYEEALLTLQRIHKTESEPDFYRREFNQIKAQIELEKSEQVGLKTVLIRPSYRKRFLIILIWVVGQQTTGVIPMQNYQVILYGSLGLKDKMPLVLVGVWGTVGVLCNCPGAWWFDSWGRRRAFFISMGIMLPSSILICAFWATYERTGNSVAIWGELAIWAMFMFLVGYAVIVNAFSYTYIPEIMPLAVRAASVAAAFGFANALVILLVQVTPIAIEAISWRYFMIFVIGDGIFLVLFYLYFPETTRKTLEEIAEIFGDRLAVKIEDASNDVDLKEVQEHDVVNKTAVQEHVERL